MEKKEKKIIASFELFVMIASIFAFSYITYTSTGVFGELDEAYKEARAERDKQLAEAGEKFRESTQPERTIWEKIVGYLKKPLIPVVSAEEERTFVGYDPAGNPIYLTEKTTKTTFDIGGGVGGCCFLVVDGSKCATTSEGNCASKSFFADGALCASTSFCRKGCCFDEASGTYDKNVLEGDCQVEWVRDPNCNMPGARLGCCVLGTTSIFETQGQCETDTLGRALGPDSVVDWRGGVNEGECLLLSATQKEGACVLAGKTCKFGTEVDCMSYGGQFNEGYLCSSASLNTSCSMTEQTTCVDGKDGVYFLDSCGNYANIYDSSKAKDPTYWDRVLTLNESCGANSAKGNAKNKECGNCNRFLGGFCGSAVEDDFGVNLGNFYCKDTSCMYKGKNYKNGESWCVYDGAIGNGDDVVGSRHWKYVCSQGVVQIEPCADYRNQICVQSNTFDVGGNNVQFKNAACIANNWRECIDINGEEGGLEKCEETLNCRVEKVAIADKFNFDVCLPKYPGGFSLKNERYMESAEKICGMADQTCTVVYKEKMFGGCEIVANGDCLEGGFAQGMNDFCRGLGDCGGAVNIEGVYSENYKVSESPMLSPAAIQELKDLAKPVPGQFAEFEDYTKFLEAAGIWGKPGPTPEGEDAADVSGGVMMVGVAGIAVGGAMVAYGVHLAGTFTAWVASAGGAPFAAFAGAAIAFGVGMIAGSMLAKAIGLSPGGSILMAVGVGLLAMTYFTWTLLGPIPAIVGIILILISLFFGGGDCDPVEVTFECKPWKAPLGGGDCEKCNKDDLKPCSEYRCNSLGAACELINKGTEQEMCHSSKDDGKPPILNPQLDVISGTEKYGDITKGGFSITNLNGGCVDAYTPLVFGVVTDELAYCKFDIEAKDFAEMDYDLGANAYLYDHTTTFTLPDPSHGQSQGANWTGDLTLYIKCQDAFGHMTPSFYTVEMCVKEGPDRTAPIIRAMNPLNDAIVSFDKTSSNVSVITNELATCKWDVADMDYSAMANEMVCLDTLGKQSNPQGYLCMDELLTSNPENLFYIRCKDQPWLNESSERNSNQESTLYLLRKPEKKIEIDWIEPSQDFEVNTEMTTIELQVQTSGGGEFHFCSYSFSGYENTVEFFETGSERIHKQPLNRPAGTDKIYVQCKDETGDFVQSTTEFKIIYDSSTPYQDSSTPQVARVWQMGNTLHIITTEEADCVYSTNNCNFEWEEGTSAGGVKEHTISVISGKKYHIKCRDGFGNAPTGCSISVGAV